MIQGIGTKEMAEMDKVIFLCTHKVLQNKENI